MAENSTKPKIRFKGFSDDWEHLEFRDLGSIAMNKRIFKNQTSETGDVPFYKIGTFGGQPDAFISRQLFEEYKTKFSYPRIGDILLSASGSIGRVVEYTGADEYFQDSNIVWLEHDERLDNSFLKHFYSIVKWQGLEGSTIKRLYNKNILDTEINLPHINEQLKIGDFFKDIDSLINLHQNKYDKLVNIKKAMLEKIFPKNGSKFPEIRFKGFADDWKEHEFLNVFTMLQNNTLSRADLNYEQGSAKCVHYGDVLIKFGECLDVKQEELPFISDDTIVTKYKASFLQNGDVIMADAAEDETVGKCCEIDGIGNQILISGLHTIPFRPIEAFATGYLGYYMNSSAYHNQLLPLMQGTKVSSVSKSALRNTTITYPKSLEEQQKIGEYFTNLDNLIDLHQRKYDKLINIKKAMLEKMFV